MASRILVVDDFILECEGLVRLLQDERDFAVAATASTREDALRLATELRPQAVLIDASLAGSDAFQTVGRICEISTRPAVIVLDDRFNATRVQDALRHGVRGYVLRRDPFRLLVNVLRDAMAGRTSFCPEVARQVVSTPNGYRVDAARHDSPLAQLTRRELEVLQYLAKGLSVKQCANQLHLAESTVDNHKSRMMRKLKVRKTVDLARLAITEGVVSL